MNSNNKLITWLFKNCFSSIINMENYTK